MLFDSSILNTTYIQNVIYLKYKYYIFLQLYFTFKYVFHLHWNTAQL